MDSYKKLESKGHDLLINSSTMIQIPNTPKCRCARANKANEKKEEKKHIQNVYKIGTKEERRQRRISYQCFDFNLIYIFVFP